MNRITFPPGLGVFEPSPAPRPQALPFSTWSTVAAAGPSIDGLGCTTLWVQPCAAAVLTSPSQEKLVLPRRR